MAARFLVVILLSCFLQDAFCAPRKDLSNPVNPEDSEAENTAAEETDDVEDRINLSFHRGHANAYGPGGMSQSDALSQGVQIGIHRPGQMDVPLFEDSRSYGASHSYGAAPPRTWAGANNQNGYGYNRGGANAGFSGGLYGDAQTQSRNQHIEIPIGDGAVLFSNLHVKKHPDGKEKAKNTASGKTPTLKK